MLIFRVFLFTLLFSSSAKANCQELFFPNLFDALLTKTIPLSEVTHFIENSPMEQVRYVKTFNLNTVRNQMERAFKYDLNWPAIRILDSIVRFNELGVLKGKEVSIVIEHSNPHSFKSDIEMTEGSTLLVKLSGRLVEVIDNREINNSIEVSIEKGNTILSVSLPMTQIGGSINLHAHIGPLHLLPR